MFTTGDPLKDQKMQESLDRFRNELFEMIQNGGEEGVYSEFMLEDITLKDIDKYLKLIGKRQDLPFKLFKCSFVRVNDSDTHEMLCDYTNVHEVAFDPTLRPRLYFIETSDFAVTVIPIQLDESTTNVHIEPLEYSPKFVRDMYDNLGKLRMEDIEFVKFPKQE